MDTSKAARPGRQLNLRHEAAQMPTDHDLWPALRRYWHAVAMADQVLDKPVPIRLLGERLVLARLGNRLACFRDLCVHRGTPLSLGFVDGDAMVCGYHGWAYDAEGTCIRIPSLPEGRAIPARARAEAYRVEERYGLIWVALDEPARPIPEFDEFDDPRFTGYFIGPFVWKCSAARAVENFVDQAHFAWVHEGVLGDRSRPEVPDIQVERQPDSIRFALEDAPNPSQPVAHRRVYRVDRPFTVYQQKRRDVDAAREVFFYTVSPTAPKEALNFLWIMRDYDLTPLEEARRKEISRIAAEQDRVVVESQRPEELPLDLAAEMHLKGPDSVAVAYRRMLAELGVE